MPGKTPLAICIRIQNHPVDTRRIVLQPGKQRGPEVEADTPVIIQNARDAVFAIENASSPVRGVALRSNALIPVVVRSSRVLRLNRLKPGIFPRRLVKMAVNADIAI